MKATQFPFQQSETNTDAIQHTAVFSITRRKANVLIPLLDFLPHFPPPLDPSISSTLDFPMLYHLG